MSDLPESTKKYMDIAEELSKRLAAVERERDEWIKFWGSLEHSHKMATRFGEMQADLQAALAKSELQAEALKVAREAIQRVHDDEETGHWGPDVTMKSVLAGALVRLKELDGI